VSDILEKVITSTHMGGPEGSGQLPPQQVDRFLTYTWDATVLGQETRKIRMNSDSVEVDRLAIGERLLRVATEAVDDHVNVHPVFSKISLTSAKLRLDWELSTEALEDNIEGADLEDTVARLITRQVGNDMEDLAINGDSATTDTLFRAFDGYRKIANTAGNALDLGPVPGTDPDGAGPLGDRQPLISREILARALKMMPRKYMQNRAGLRFYMGSNLASDYQSSLIGLSEATTIAALQGAQMGSPTLRGGAGRQFNFAFGVPTFEVPMFPENLNEDGTDLAGAGDDQHGSVELTFPENRIWGIKREVKVYREFKPKKDTIEYTVFTRVAAAVENPEAYVIVNNIRVADF
jgi:hypothetical protein